MKQQQQQLLEIGTLWKVIPGKGGGLGGPPRASWPFYDSDPDEQIVLLVRVETDKDYLYFIDSSDHLVVTLLERDSVTKLGIHRSKWHSTFERVGKRNVQ